MSETMSAAEYRQKKPRKYRNIKTEVDGILFDSKREAARYGELKRLEKNGDIENLGLQPVFKIQVRGRHICKYIGDFSYFAGGRRVVEDVKSPASKTPVYRLKKKLVEASYCIEIQEVS